MKKHPDRYFMLVDTFGIICSVAGILLSLWSYRHNEHNGLTQKELLPFIIMLFPYLVVIMLWILGLIRLKRSRIYDEKIVSDMNKSGLTVFIFAIITVAAMTIRSFLNRPSGFIFIHNRLDIVVVFFFLFAALLLFSVTTLFYYKRN